MSFEGQNFTPGPEDLEIQNEEEVKTPPEGQTSEDVPELFTGKEIDETLGGQVESSRGLGMPGRSVDINTGGVKVALEDAPGAGRRAEYRIGEAAANDQLRQTAEEERPNRSKFSANNDLRDAA